MRVCVAHSDDPSGPDAVEELVRHARAEIGADRPIAAVLYASTGYDHAQVVRDLRAAFPHIPLVGCTTDGECSSVLAFTEDSLVLTVFVSDRVTAVSGIGRGLAHDPVAAARAAWDTVSAAGMPSLVLVLSESLGVSGVAVVRALEQVVPPAVPVVGGTAGDQWRFEATRQMCGDEVVQDSLVMLALHGPLQVGVGVASGWAPMGQAARVTNSEGPLVFELDGRPAMEWFQRHFGEREAPSPEHPFAVYDPPGSDAYYLRAPYRYVEERGAILFAADVPQGADVRVTEATRASVLDGAVLAVRQAASRISGPPAAVLMFSCAARKQVLGTRTREEVDRLRAGPGDGLPLAGFYTYGEIAPLGVGEGPRFHNETVVAVLLAE